MEGGASTIGSRIDDRALGGNIDLLVEIDHPVGSPVLLGARIGVRLQQVLGECRIDVLVTAPNIAQSCRATFTAMLYAANDCRHPA